MKLNQILGITSLLTLGVLPFLAACSNDSSTSSLDYSEFSETSSSSKASSSSAKKTSVKTTFELGSCSYENDGEQIYVSGENDYYTCTYSYTSYDYTWIRFLQFGEGRKEWMLPKSGINAKGELQMSVYNDRLDIACRVSEVSQWDKTANNPNR